MKSKVKNLEKKTKVILLICIVIIGFLVVFTALHYKKSISNKEESNPEITVTESSQNAEKSDMSDMSEPLEITINLTEHYITHGSPYPPRTYNTEIREISITLMIIMYYGEVEGMNMDSWVKGYKTMNFIVKV